MKRLQVFVAVSSLALLGAAFLQVTVLAKESTPMTEAHIARIRANCVEAQSSLTQLHATDALLRVNRGQLYESISTKLMIPFTSRVALNRLDSLKLPAIASQYERQLSAFRTTYQQYEEAMTRTLKINCTNQPVAFYDSIADAREKRKLTHDSTVELHKIVQNYKVEFEAFVKKFQEGAA